MPLISPIESQGLAISLAQKRRFRPGETIIGSVTRSAHIVDSDAQLSISFLGRAKVKMFVRRGQGTATYRSRYIFWDTRNPPASATLHKGPVHIPPNATEPQSWPFAITIPTRVPEETLYQDEEWSTFLKPGDPETTQMPNSYTAYGDDHLWGSATQAYVDYHLKAVLQDSKGHMVVAIMPIKVDSPSSPIPITDFGVKAFRGRRMVLTTHRLNPALAKGKLTFGQKAQHVFGSSRVPTLTFQIVANTPSVLQVGNPNLIPFEVQASLIKNETSEIIRDLHPRLIITKFILRLTANCKYIAPTIFNSQNDNAENTFNLVCYSHPTKSQSARSPSPPQVNETTNAAADVSKRESKSTKVRREHQMNDDTLPDADTLILPMDSAPLPLDLGKALQIKLPFAVTNRVIPPSFRTFNIHVTHVLSWEMQVEAAGQEATFTGKNAVNVMSRSEETPG